MTRLHVWIAAGMLLFFAAGFFGGITSSRVNNHPAGRNAGPREPHMFQELNLTDDQREKLRPIWEELARKAPPPSPDKFDKIQDEFQAKLNALFTPEQLQQYKKLQEEFETQMADMRKDVDTIFKQADEKTRAILTPEQRVKFDEIRSRVHKGPKMMTFGGPGGPGRGPGGPGPDRSHGEPKPEGEGYRR